MRVSCLLTSEAICVIALGSLRCYWKEEGRGGANLVSTIYRRPGGSKPCLTPDVESGKGRFLSTPSSFDLNRPLYENNLQPNRPLS